MNQQLLKDTLTTAVEGGIGYWLAAGTVERDEEGNAIALRNCRDAEDSSSLFDDITLDTVKRGIDELRMHAELAAARYNKAVIEALADPENSGVFIDADVADVIVQVGLFGEVVYG